MLGGQKDLGIVLYGGKVGRESFAYFAFYSYRVFVKTYKIAKGSFFRFYADTAGYLGSKVKALLPATREVVSNR